MEEVVEVPVAARGEHAEGALDLEGRRRERVQEERVLLGPGRAEVPRELVDEAVPVRDHSGVGAEDTTARELEHPDVRDDVVYPTRGTAVAGGDAVGGDALEDLLGPHEREPAVVGGGVFHRGGDAGGDPAAAIRLRVRLTGAVVAQVARPCTPP